MKYAPINLEEKFSKLSEPWAAGIIGELNDYQFKLVKIVGEYVWHEHPETDEVFFVIEGSLQIEFRDGSVILNSDEMFFVPKGVEHKPSSAEGCKIMLVEPRGIDSKGETEHSYAEENDVWI